MMRKIRAAAIAAAVVLVAAVLGACGKHETPATVSAAAPAAAPTPTHVCGKPDASTPAASPAMAGKPSDKPYPTLRIATVDGGTFDLSAQCGKWVVVNFWATWCGPCLEEIPDLSAFQKAHKDVAIIGLDFETIEKPELQEFLKKHTPGYPIAMVDTFHPPLDFDAPRAMPTSYLIDPNGHVAKKFMGPVTSKELQQMLDRAQPRD